MAICLGIYPIFRQTHLKMFGFHSFAFHPHGQLRQHSRTSTADCTCVLGSQMCGNISRSLGHGQELAKWFPMQLQPFWDTLERQKHQETKLTVSILCVLKWLKKQSHAHRLPRVLDFQGMAMASFTISSSLKTIATGASSVPQPQETNSLTIRLAKTYKWDGIPSGGPALFDLCFS